MLRLQSNEKETFSAALTASAQETEAALFQRRREMGQAWDDIDKGWQELQEHMKQVGITRPLEAKEGMVKLNVGGSVLTFRRSALEGERRESSTWALENLFEAEWDEGVPRDSDGRILLDESPTCVKHLVHALLARPASAKGSQAIEGGLAVDDEPDFLHYTARVLGLSGHSAPVGMSIQGGTTIFEPHEENRLTAVVRDWFPGHSDRLELLYRASRDGWTGPAFHAKCRNDSPSTITFFRVKSHAIGETDSIIGGFSNISWTPDNTFRACQGAFLFMLKDGKGSGSGSSQPMKWGVKDTRANYGVYRAQGYGPTFGGGKDLKAIWNGNASTVQTRLHSYNIPAGSSFFTLDGRPLVEIEAYRVCAKPTGTSPSAEHRTVNDRMAPVRTSDDVPTFGHSIAGSLMEEEMVLQEAGNELARAKARMTTCATALAAVYGPDVAMGKEEDVVELSVRGTRITTLRSTLQVCPDSALAAMFDEDKWPAAKKDLDSNGRRVIDCKPSVFSKVLDVLRVTKRVAWAGSEEVHGRHDETRVTVTANDCMAFKEFVNMYFPGCENFVMEHVDLLGGEDIDR